MIPRSEVRTKQYLKKNGYDFIRSGRSFGLWDFVAFNKHEILLIQAKANQGPRKAELDRLKSFNNCPINVKREIWVWRIRAREPMRKAVSLCR